jgi:hypothetical protein
VTKRGRQAGATSWTGNPVNVAAHYASLLMECWLADTPIIETRLQLGLISGNGESLIDNSLIEDCWKKRGTNRRFNVPKPIKQKLCRLAIAYVVKLHEQTQELRLEIEASMQRAKLAAEAELRSRGMSDAEIAGWFKTLAERARKRSHKEFRAPNLTEVLTKVDRHAPSITLRRKASCRILRN